MTSWSSAITCDCTLPSRQTCTHWTTLIDTHFNFAQEFLPFTFSIAMLTVTCVWSTLVAAIQTRTDWQSSSILAVLIWYISSWPNSSNLLSKLITSLLSVCLGTVLWHNLLVIIIFKEGLTIKASHDVCDISLLQTLQLMMDGCPAVLVMPTAQIMNLTVPQVILSRT